MLASSGNGYIDTRMARGRLACAPSFADTGASASRGLTGTSWLALLKQCPDLEAVFSADLRWDKRKEGYDSDSRRQLAKDEFYYILCFPWMRSMHGYGRARRDFDSDFSSALVQIGFG
ncbi:hypothetical protein EON65_56135 [archaeon]|nr:MAG: hypothetical protein EON65_56135 [archaeon]